MKKLLTFIPAFLWMTGIIAQDTTERTISNLKAEYQSESNFVAKYTAYAAKAKSEGYQQIATLFTATAKSEAIHATHARISLEKLNVDMTPDEATYKVKSTAENLQEAIDEQTRKAANMYPGFISTAKEEKVMEAVKTFTWASNTEKKHIEFYKTALAALNSKKMETLPAFYWICPKCGNTFNEATPSEKCPFCYTPREKYEKVM
jgi:rubrerythrin